jgi:hypothetical protein
MAVLVKAPCHAIGTIDARFRDKQHRHSQWDIGVDCMVGHHGGQIPACGTSHDGKVGFVYRIFFGVRSTPFQTGNAIVSGSRIFVLRGQAILDGCNHERTLARLQPVAAFKLGENLLRSANHVSACRKSNKT